MKTQRVNSVDFGGVRVGGPKSVIILLSQREAAAVATLDGPIRANQAIRANHLRIPELNHFVANRIFRALKIANCGFETIRANRSHVMKLGAFLRIDSHELISHESSRFALRISGPSTVAPIEPP